MITNNILFGSPLPPPHTYKIDVIKYYQNVFDIQILLETGTYMGETIFACKDAFNQIYSIEISKNLFDKATIKFENSKNVHLYLGDSSEVIKDILKRIDQSTLFWLDGHYSGGITEKGAKNTPILEELTAIFDHKIDDHLILIDDARCFIGEEDYPSLFELKDFISELKPQFDVIVKHDIIRIGSALNRVSNP